MMYMKKQKGDMMKAIPCIIFVRYVLLRKAYLYAYGSDR